MIPTNEQLAEWDRRHVWHAFTQMAEYDPLIIERAEGCTLYDTAGRAYLDGVSSLWCNLFGHRHPRIDAALRRQLDKVAHVTNLGLSNPTTIQLAKELTDVAPTGLQHVFFSDDGATAVEVALKLAFQYQHQRSTPQPQKTRYLALGDAYHGDTLGAVSVGGVARFHALFNPLLFPVMRLPTPGVYRVPDAGRDDPLAYHTAQLRAALEQHHHELAAVVIEPLIQCAAGMITHPPGYLQAVRHLTREYDVLLIADEVAVGMGRTGRLFATEAPDCAPDLLCLAKGLTGGYVPLAATLTTTEIWQAFLGPFESGRTFFHGHTYGGNPLGAAAAREVLAIFREEPILAGVQQRAALLSERLQPLAAHPAVGDIRQIGLIAGIELVADQQTRTPLDYRERRGAKICRRALEQGVWLRPLGNVLVIMPPLTIAPDELTRIVAVLHSALRDEFA